MLVNDNQNGYYLLLINNLFNLHELTLNYDHFQCKHKNRYISANSSTS